MYFSALSRPSLLAFKAAREVYQIEHVDADPNKCIFTRTAAFEPGFATRYLLGFVTYPHFKKLFTQKCPKRLLKSIQGKKLPVAEKKD